jgi:hypothetical protein
MKTLLKIIFFTFALLITQNVFSQDSFNSGLPKNDSFLDINLPAMDIQMQKIMPLCSEHNCNFRPHPVLIAIGSIFITAGIVAIVTSPFVFTFGNNDPDNFSFNNPAVVISASLFGGGIFSLMTGALMTGK